MNVVVETINGAGGAFVDFALPMLVQSSVLVVILLLVDAALRKRVRAVFRYWIWMLVLAKLVLPASLGSPVSIGRWLGDPLTAPTVALYELSERQPTAPTAEPRSVADSVLSHDPPTFLVKPASPTEDRYLPAAHPQAAGTQAGMDPEPLSGSVAIPSTPAPAPSLSWQGLVLLSWAAVAAALLLLLLWRSFFVRGLVAQADETSAAMVSDLNQCRRRIGMRREVALKLSAIAGSPAACGLIHPVILIPQHLAPRLAAHDLQAVLLHELAHIKRGDLWINLAQTLLQIVYFYNPLLWLANAIIRRTREQAVDEAVLVAMGEAAPRYPETLVNVAKLAFRKRPGLSLRLIGVVESKSALSARIKHILTRPIPKSAKLGLLGLLAIFIIAVVLLPMAEMLEPLATVVNDGPLDIRFLGVCPDQSSDILDGDGGKIAPVAYPRTGRAAWEPDTLRRDFLFELPEANEPILFSHHRLVSVAGEDIRLHQSDASPLYPVVVDGRKVAAVETYIPRVYRKLMLRFFRRTLAIQRVDVTLKYFYGPPRQTLVSFQGPFAEGQVLADAQMPGAKLTVLPEQAYSRSVEQGASFRLDLPFELDYGTPVLVYDTEGKRSPAWASTMSTGGRTTTLEFHNYPQYLSLSNVARVAVEKPYAFTVRNVRVNYPDRPPRAYAAYVDAMAQRLGWTGTPEQLAEHQTLDPQQAIKVIDVVEGGYIPATLQALKYGPRRVKISGLDRATRERIHQTAARWIESGYRPYGIQLGLMGQWPEFLDMAIEELANRRPTGEYSYQERARIDESRSVASALQQSELELNASQVEKLKQIVLNTDDGRIQVMLLWCLASTDTPEAIAALWELAQDDRPWIWWKATEMWHSRTARTRRGYDDLPGKMRLRLFLTSGIPVDAKLKAEASALLPQIFTPELGQMTSEVWRIVHEKIASGSDRKAGTEAFLNYLRQMQSAMTERLWVGNYGYANDATWMVAHVIRTLNVWYGVDIGHLGTVEAKEWHETKPNTFSDFQNLIAQVLQWHEGNRDAEPLEVTFRGKVVDTAGRPIAMAELGLTRAEDYVDARGQSSQRQVDAGQCRTDTAGGFVFSKLRNTSHALRVAAEGFVTLEHVSVTRLPDGRFRISEGTDNTIVMEKPASLSGRVTGPDGRPMANVRVELWRCPSDRYFHPDPPVTDAEGRFTAGSLISGDYLVQHRGIERPPDRGEFTSAKAFQLVVVEEGQAVENVILDLRHSTCSLEFEIVDRDDQPILGESVALLVPLPSDSGSFATISGAHRVPAKSVHRLDSLPPMDGFLSVYTGGQGPKRVEARLRPNQTTRCRVKFNLAAAEMEIPVPPRESQARYEVSLPNGIKVALLGLKDARAADNVWWAPDGSPLPEPVHTRNLGVYGPPGDAFRLEDTVEREIAFRLTGATDPNVSPVFELHVLSSGAGPVPVSSYRHSLIARAAGTHLRSENIIVPREAKGGDLRIGFDVRDEDELWKDRPRRMWASFIHVTFQPGVKTHTMAGYSMPAPTRRLEPAELDRVQRYVSVAATPLQQGGYYGLPKNAPVTLFDVTNAARFEPKRTADAFLEVVRQVDLGETRARLIYSRNIEGLFNGKEADIRLEPGDTILGSYAESPRGEKTPAQYRFGDVITVALPDENNRPGPFIDLDTGKLHHPPAGLDTRDSDAFGAWMAANSIDARFERAPPVQGLVGLTMLALEVDDRLWSGATGIHDRLLTKAEVPVLLSGDDYPPTTYLIKTDQQRTGILQILDPAAGPDGTSIRYKFLQDPPGTSDSQPSDTQIVHDIGPSQSHARTGNSTDADAADPRWIGLVGDDQAGSGEALREILGVVVDPNGRPIADAWVTVENKDLLLEPEPKKFGLLMHLVVREDTAQSDSTGRFVLTGLRPGATDIRVWADGHRTELVQAVPAGTMDLRVVLEEPRPYTVSGVVVDSRGMPLGEASVTLVSELFTAQDAGKAVPPVTVRTDANGTFRFSETFQ